MDTRAVKVVSARKALWLYLRIHGSFSPPRTMGAWDDRIPAAAWISSVPRQSSRHGGSVETHRVDLDSADTYLCPFSGFPPGCTMQVTASIDESLCRRDRRSRQRH